MLETKRLRDIYEEAARSLEQINAWQREQEAKEEKMKSLIREKNRKEQKIKDIKSGNKKVEVVSPRTKLYCFSIFSLSIFASIFRAKK